MRVVYSNLFLLVSGILLVGCAGGGGRPGSEIPVATTQEPLPQRQTLPPSTSNQTGLSASRSEPIIYDYPGATRNLNAPAPVSSPKPAAPTVLPSPSPVTAHPIQAATAGRSHTVQSGDTLWGLSKKYGVSVEALRTMNALTTDTIKPGQTLKIP
jgi:LysM repeat protein